MKVLLVALNAKYIHSSLALRSLKSYSKDYDEHIQTLELTINHDEGEMIKQIYKEAPDVIGFSCYIWNMRFIKTLIPTIKKILPQTEIILGGPEVSYGSEELFDELPIDLVIEGEGEATFREYLQYKLGEIESLECIDGIVYRFGNKIIRTPDRKPIALDSVPFMYDNLGELENKIIYYEASRGCPFNCQYCLSSIEKGVRFMSLERVTKDMQYFLDNRVKQVKFVDRTFNANKKYAMHIWQYIIDHDNGHTNFHFEIAAELLDDEILKSLIAARPGLIQFEIGVQSTNPEVLTVIKRKMSFELLRSIVQTIKGMNNIHQHLDLIAGLPHENYESFKNSFNDVIALRPEQFQLGFLKLLKGSGLRINAEHYGIVYREDAPYEVLYTNDITYGELLKLHAIEEMVERYYNSQRFKNALEYGYTLCENPFDFYERLSLYWEQKEYDKVQHNKAAYYLHLVDFMAALPNANQVLVKEFIRLDWFMHEMIKEVPESLITFEDHYYKDIVYKCLKDDEWTLKYAPESIAIPFKQRKKKIHIECFHYDIYNFDYKKQLPEKLSVPQAILFDYTQESVQAKIVGIEGGTHE